MEWDWLYFAGQCISAALAVTIYGLVVYIRKEVLHK